MSFEQLGLKPELLRAVADKGYTIPTPIQLEAIPAVLAGRDVLAGAQTGTGKTAGFTLPILQKLGARGARNPRALVLVPTRELAAQVELSVQDYGKYVDLRSFVVFGGVSERPQISALRNGCDILVATPGRLLDLCEQRAVSLADVQIFVLDEADRMLDMGFIRDIKRVLKMLPAQRQNLMFSATYSDEIRALSNSFVKNPVSVQVTPRNATAEKVEQCAYRVPKDHKRHLLAHLINEGNWHQVLVFTRTKHGANRLSQQLERFGITSMAIHGNKSQNARVRALEDFKENKIIALVATEVAARGLDIKELPHVVNYELPNVPEDYVHRIGRTARAGSSGAAVSLVSPDELSYLRDIEKLLKRKIDFLEAPKFEVKEGTAPTRAETSGETGDYAPHQDPRRRNGHGRTRGGGGGGRSGGRSGGGHRPPAGSASHDAYLEIAHAPDGAAPSAGGESQPAGERAPHAHREQGGGGRGRPGGRRGRGGGHGGGHRQGDRSGGQQGGQRAPSGDNGQRPAGAQGGPRADGPRHGSSSGGHGGGKGRGGGGQRRGGGGGGDRSRGTFARGARSRGPGGGSSGGSGGSGGFSRLS